MADPAPPRVAPVQDQYPRLVGDDADLKRRWDLCMAVAAENMGYEPGSAQAWPAALVLFQSDIPT